MRKALIVIIIIILAAGGYLGWDWYDKTRNQKLEPGVTLYYWTDSEGNRHFSDTAPPKNARNVYKDKGYKYIKPPLIVTIKNRAVQYFKKTKERLFKADKTQKK